MLTTYPKKEDGSLPAGTEKRIYVLTAPTEDEIAEASEGCGMNSGMIRSALDDNALSRIHFNDQVAVYLSVPYLTRQKLKQKSIKRVRTFSAGLFFNRDNMIFISAQQADDAEKILTESAGSGTPNDILFLRILYQNALQYIHFLKQIDRDAERLENSLKRRVTNLELFQLMDYQRSLTGISTSLRGLDHIMCHIQENRNYFGSVELLEDTEVAVRQATEMAQIFDSDLDALMDAFGSVLSNNVNQIMKILTSLTLIIAIPTMIAGFFGMNVLLPLDTGKGAFWIIIGFSAAVSVLTGIIFYRKKML